MAQENNQRKMLVCFMLDRSHYGNSHIQDLTLNMNVVYENGDEIERRETNPRVLYYTSEDSSCFSLANLSSDSAIGNLARPNADQRNSYEADDESQRDSVSWLSENSNPSRQRSNELEMIRRNRNIIQRVSKKYNKNII